MELVEKVARAICQSIPKYAGYDRCDQCNGTTREECTLWTEWVNEAKAAIAAMSE